MVPTSQELKDEIDNDPLGLGYKVGGLWKDDVAIAGLLNEIGASAETVDVEFIEPWKLQSAVVGSEFVALADTAQRAWLAVVGLERVPVKDAGLRAQIGAIWGAGTTTRSNLTALQARPASRAEALWGEGVRIAHLQVAQARLLP